MDHKVGHFWAKIIHGGHGQMMGYKGPNGLPMDPFEVIFLDIDGVLNRTRAATHIRLDEDLVLLLKDLVIQSEAHIVLSTYWSITENHHRCHI